jgi:hypothetical protein
VMQQGSKERHTVGLRNRSEQKGCPQPALQSL